MPPVVFYVASHGLAGDHWFDWFSKALNAHPDIYIYMGESVRAKYLKERSRKERPGPGPYTKLLQDMGAAYKAVGETYAYRSYQLYDLPENVRMVNLVRHPYSWLDYYVDWRVGNMNMPEGDTSGVDHEWSVVSHADIGDHSLREYQREDVEIWAAYQGMVILNRMTSDKLPGVRNVRLESVVGDSAMFARLVDYLTQGAICYDGRLLDLVYSWVDHPWRLGGVIRDNPAEVYKAWPKWKRTAFARLVSSEAIDTFEDHGYQF